VEQELPAKIGRYEIRRELGRGMMGVVYEAHDPALGRRIALKTIRLAFAVTDEERRRFEERFLTEARLAARLSHPGIVVVHDVGQDAETGTLFIALEFLEGRTGAELVAEGRPLDWRQALHVTRRVAEALHHAHSAGIIHRDIKPANIMVLPSGEPKIMDFGIAKVETSHLTATGQFFGTPLYMSPEQALGRTLDARSDLFSLGTLAYVLLTGRQPYAGSGVPRIITRVLNEDPDPPSHLVRSLPPEVDYIVARALAKAPEDRYPDGKTMADDIEDVLSGRPPRHRHTWVAPRRADGTLVSLPAADEAAVREPLPVRAGVPAPAGVAPRPARVGARPRPAPPPPRKAFTWTAAAGVAAAFLVLGALGGVALMRSRSRTAAEPAALATARPPERSLVPTAPPKTLSVPSVTAIEASPEAIAPPKVAEDAPAAAPEPTLPLPPPASGERSTVDAARLAVDFEHSLKHGTLRVWVDDVLVVEERLDSRVTRKVAALKLRKGSVEETLEMSPGRHEVKVQVAWEDNVKTQYISGHFSPGSTRRLSAKLGAGLGGLVKKDLKLEWE
jgi:serine/threonine-protein kinase